VPDGHGHSSAERRGRHVPIRLVAAGEQLLELLTCHDIRFWVEIVLATGEVERHLQHCPADTPIDAVARRFDIPRPWQLEMLPAPQLDQGPVTLEDLPAGQTIEAIGIVPGCTLRFVSP
jgi:hypothetical protein